MRRSPTFQKNEESPTVDDRGAFVMSPLTRRALRGENGSRLGKLAKVVSPGNTHFLLMLVLLAIFAIGASQRHDRSELEDDMALVRALICVCTGRIIRLKKL
jgi:hypothetical protein